MDIQRSLALALVLVLGSAGCASTIKQDARTGKDGKPKGAKKIKLEEGEGRARDIITYPGGDRVDWKVFELEQPGDVTITLKWRPPRPGLDLSFNVLDETFHVLKRVRPSTSGETLKEAEFRAEKPGKYYVQVYASERKDAGDYIVDVVWREAKPDETGAVRVAIPNPPRLPGVPTQQALAPGATPPGEQPPPMEPTEPPAPLPPRRASILEKAAIGAEVIVTLDKGSNAGIKKGWVGIILMGNSTNPLGGSQFTIYKVSEEESWGRVRKLSLSEIGDNFRVLVSEPSPAGP